MLAGLGFVLAAWGLDFAGLARAEAIFPWLKLLLGGTATLLVCTLAGWLVGRMDKVIPGILVWILVGGFLAWVASRLPFDGVYTFLLEWLDPQLKGMIDYPLSATVGARLGLLLFILTALFTFVGLLELPMIDTATQASAPAARWLPLCLCIPLALAAGFSADDMFNQPFRQPIASMDRLIRFAIQNQGQEINTDLARSMHLATLDPVMDVLNQPRRLIVGNYDDVFSDVYVMVDFGGKWSRCEVFNGAPLFCEPLNAANPSASAQAAVVGTPAPNYPPAGATVAATNPASFSSSTLTATPTISAAQPPAASPAASMPAGSITLSNPALLLPEQSGLPASLSAAPQYTITVSINYSAHSFEGQETVLYTNAENTSLDRVYFRLFPNGHSSYGNGSLQVSQVTLDSMPAQTRLSLSDSVLEVPFAQSLAPGKQALFRLDFAGAVPVDFGGSATPAGYGIFNFTDSVLTLANWYPILAVYDQKGWNLNPVSDIGDSVYSDMAFYHIDLTTDRNVVTAATGVATANQDSGSQTRYHFESGPARDFIIAMSPNFKKTSRTVAGTQVNAYTLPGDDRGGDMALKVASDSLQIYNEHIGVYPYTELDVVETPMRYAAGVEYPGIVLIGQSQYQNSSDPSFSVTVAHEVAHQWWYNIVGDDVINEPWLDEALATYTSSLYEEFHFGPNAASGLMEYYQNRFDQLKALGKDDAVAQSLGHFESLNDPRVYSGVVYIKGALFFAALRHEIGDRLFFAGLQDYYQTYQYRIATGDDLRKVFETTSGKDLRSLYQEWLDSPKK